MVFWRRIHENFSALRVEKRFGEMVQGAWARQYIAMLEREERAGFQQPERVMETLAFEPGERVADVGAAEDAHEIVRPRVQPPGSRAAFGS